MTQIRTPLDAETQNAILRPMARSLASAAEAIPLMEPVYQQQAITFVRQQVDSTLNWMDGLTDADGNTIVDPNLFPDWHSFDSMARRCEKCPVCGRAWVPTNTAVPYGTPPAPNTHVHGTDDW